MKTRLERLLPWPFSLLCTSNSIYTKCYYRNVKVTAKVYKPCLCFFISFSLFPFLTPSVTFPSSSKPLFLPSLHRLLYTHSLYQCTSVCTYTWRTKLSQNLNRMSILFYRSTWRHATYKTHDRLEWFLNRILSFSKSVHATYETMTDYRQCGARSGSPQLLNYACICISRSSLIGSVVFY